MTKPTTDTEPERWTQAEIDEINERARELCRIHDVPLPTTDAEPTDSRTATPPPESESDAPVGGVDAVAAIHGVAPPVRNTGHSNTVPTTDTERCEDVGRLSEERARAILREYPDADLSAFDVDGDPDKLAADEARKTLAAIATQPTDSECNCPTPWHTGHFSPCPNAPKPTTDTERCCGRGHAESPCPICRALAARATDTEPTLEGRAIEAARFGDASFAILELIVHDIWDREKDRDRRFLDAQHALEVAMAEHTRRALEQLRGRWGWRLETRGDVRVLVHGKRGCRPAELTEIRAWDAIDEAIEGL